MNRNTVTLAIVAAFWLAQTVWSPAAEQVRIWEEPLVLPTDVLRPADKNPMFQRPLSYQGATRSIYPYPLQDNFTNNRQDRTYNAVYLENEYIKLCVLPELGGRLFYATDKTNGYEIFYRQHVIKPAHIGMLGAWISGGIEWCVFHHHRASTFMPVDHLLAENPDGSKTVWIGEIEPRHRMKWAIGITLYPGRSLIEARVKMLNRTDTTQSILYWANVATHVNDDYQVFFPPSTQIGVYHSKVEFVNWPIARTTYRGIDYKGVDVSWWKNHPKPVSIFAHQLQEGFLAGYDHGRRAGTIHVANHHVAAGAKLWEWGPSDEGRMWDCQVLTDTDGPYAELMAGAYSDNQPDYSWIKPGEVKEAVQTWYPLREIGGVKSANRQAALNLQTAPDKTIHVACNTTAAHAAARVLVTAKGKPLFDQAVEISPARPFSTQLAMPEGVKETDLEASLTTADGKRLVAYRPVDRPVPDRLPEVVNPPALPEDIKSVEELYLAGLRIKQFHNARLDAMDYLREALRRDPGDSRSNIQAGLDAAARGFYDEARERFQTAIARVAADYTRPRDCEAYYQLGLVLKRMGRLDEAYDNLYRAAWDFAFRAPAYFELAQIDCRRGEQATAREHIRQSLALNAINTRALGLESLILRRLGHPDEALASAAKALEIDPLDYLARRERFAALDASGQQEAGRQARSELERILRDHAESYLELALDYVAAGQWEDVAAVLAAAVGRQVPGLSDYPTIHYYLAFARHKLGKENLAAGFLKSARRCPTDYCFPFRLETLDVYRYALEADPKDSRARYYLGNLLFDRQPDKAMEAWKEAVALEPGLAIAHRNLGWGAYYARQDIDQAVANYERAIREDPSDPRFYIELDQLYERQGAPVGKRLALLEGHHSVLLGHEAALYREIVALVQGGQYDKAIDYLDNNFFHAGEERRLVHELYVDAHLLRGLQRFDQGSVAEALADFQAADTYPANHQIGRARGEPREAPIYALAGLCYRRLGKAGEAEAAFQKAVQYPQPGSRYNYYRGLAYAELGNSAEAAKIFDELIETGRSRLQTIDQVDVFAKFGEGDPKHVRQAEAYFVIGLGQLGRKQYAEARAAFGKAVGLDGNHKWASYYLGRVPTME